MILNRKPFEICILIPFFKKNAMEIIIIVKNQGKKYPQTLSLKSGNANNVCDLYE